MGRAKPFLECRLPDGTSVFCLNRLETKYVHREVQGYLENGIHLDEGATVFDVGANIGLFTMTALAATGGTGRVFAFEPVPEIFEVLRANTGRMDPDRVRIFPFGLGREAEQVQFSYYPEAPAVSRRSPGVSEAERVEMVESLCRKLDTLAKREDTPWYLKVLSRLPAPLQEWLVARKISKAFNETPVECRLENISKVIADESVERIDLLKIDVEGAELDVLSGIAEADWRKIHQAVIEVHDVDGRLETVRDLLAHRGLTEVACNQFPLRWGSELFTLYARRLGTS